MEQGNPFHDGRHSDHAARCPPGLGDSGSDNPHLVLTKPVIGRGFLEVLSALAEDERERLVARAADGREAARGKGVKFGPKPKLTAHQQANALERRAAGESCREISRDMGVSHSTIARLRCRV